MPATEKPAHLSFHAPATIASAFKQLASRQDLTQSQLLRRLVRQHIESTQADNPGAFEDRAEKEPAHGIEG
jgi:hypothetical protein